MIRKPKLTHRERGATNRRPYSPSLARVIEATRRRDQVMNYKQETEGDDLIRIMLPVSTSLHDDKIRETARALHDDKQLTRIIVVAGFISRANALQDSYVERVNSIARRLGDFILETDPLKLKQVSVFEPITVPDGPEGIMEGIGTVREQVAEAGFDLARFERVSVVPIMSPRHFEDLAKYADAKTIPPTSPPAQ